MNTVNTENDDSEEPFFEDPDAALREIAKNPAAYAHYLADFYRVVLEMQSKLEILQREARVHCRGTRVEGDRWGESRLRSFPVEHSLNSVLRNLRNLTSGLEKSAQKRHAHDEKVDSLRTERRQKSALKGQNGKPSLQAAPESPDRGGAETGNAGYSEPTSIFDLGNRESA